MNMFASKDMEPMSTIARSTRAFCIAIGATMVSGVATAEPVNLRFATVGVGSSWYVYGTGMSEMMREKLPEGSTVDVLPIAGGVGNMELIENGEAEIAITFSHTAGEACQEDGGATFDAQRGKVRALIGGLDTYYLAGLVTERSGINSWDEIASGETPIRMITTQRGGTGELGMRQILEAYGSGYDEIRSAGGSVRALERTATAAAIADGGADFWGHTISVGHPVATELMTLADMRILPVDSREQVDKLESLGWNAVELPAGSFDGQDEAVPMVGTVSSIVISSDVSDEVAYALTEALVENAERFSGIHAALQDFTLERAVDPAMNGNCAWHPGAEAYYRDSGMVD